MISIVKYLFESQAWERQPRIAVDTFNKLMPDKMTKVKEHVKSMGYNDKFTAPSLIRRIDGVSKQEATRKMGLIKWKKDK
jgi:hypothetical protein